MQATPGGRRTTRRAAVLVQWVPGGLRRACVVVTARLVGDAWRRVITLAALLLVGGILLVAVAEGEVWREVGTGFIGGSVVGLVFAIAQHTLDQQAMARQAAGDLRLTVTASSELEGIELAGATLSSAYLWRKQMRSANLDGARLDGADLRESVLTGARLRGADLRAADLRGADMRDAVADGADLSDARLDAGRLGGARLVGARLVRALVQADGDRGAGAPDAPTDVSLARLDAARLRDVRLPGLWASFASAVGADAAGAVLAGCDLSCADLRGAGLSGADLTGADLSGADLRGAVLARADLSGARLVGALLASTDLTGAVVAGADLGRSDLRGAFLTNVDVASASVAAAWVLPGDLVPALGSPDPAAVGAVVVDADPAAQPAAGPHEGADPVPADRPPVRALTVLADRPELVPLAREVAARLRRRRRGLDQVNGDLPGIVLNDAPPDAGGAGEQGLPDRVRVRRRQWWPRGRHPVAVLRWHEAGVEVALPGRQGSRAAALVPAPVDAGAVASCVQVALAGDGPFRSGAELDPFAGWLERPAEAPLEPALEQVLARNARNPVALLLRAWCSNLRDARLAEAASDDLRVAWAASAPGLRTALAAAQLASAQCQLAHRTSVAPERVVARAVAAGEASLALFATPATGGRGAARQRRVVLQSKAEHARSFAAHVLETLDGLDEGIRRYQAIVHRLEAEALPVSPTTRNNLAYCLMARVGRFIPGPGRGYGEAQAQLRLVLDTFGVYEEGRAGPEGPPAGAVSVQEMARRSAAGDGPPDDGPLRRAAVRLALANLGSLYRLQKRFGDALDCFGAALYCDPCYAEALGERAWVRLDAGDGDGATADMERALSVPVGTDQQRARIVLDYVDALARVGRAGDQWPWIERARCLDPTSVRAEELAREWRARFVEADG